jgi:hypothetical protein
MLLERELAALLVSDEALETALGRPERLRACWDRARDELVHVLLAHRVLGRCDVADAGLLGRARETIAGAAAREVLQFREMIRVVQALDDGGVPALLLKGAAWAYLVYPRPELRPRLDTDLLISAGDRVGAQRVLGRLGYRAVVEHVMELASAQRHFSLTAGGFTHHIDLHWRVTNPLAFAHALPFASLWPRRVSVSGFPCARTTGPADSLLLACLHRVAHHGHESGVLWMYDIHLLAGVLTESDWDDFVRCADTWRLHPVVRPALARAAEWFGTALPPAVLEWMRGSDDGLERAFSGRGVVPLEVLASDWRAAQGWRNRARLLQGHVCPSAAYMRHRYGNVPGVVLPVLYARRFATGLCRWIASYLARFW